MEDYHLRRDIKHRMSYWGSEKMLRKGLQQRDGNIDRDSCPGKPYEVNELLYFSQSPLSKQQPEGWSYFVKIYPDICLEQVDNFFNEKEFVEKRMQQIAKGKLIRHLKSDKNENSNHSFDSAGGILQSFSFGFEMDSSAAGDFTGKEYNKDGVKRRHDISFGTPDKGDFNSRERKFSGGFGTPESASARSSTEGDDFSVLKNRVSFGTPVKYKNELSEERSFGRNTPDSKTARNSMERDIFSAGQKAVMEPKENSPSLQQQPLSMPQIAHSQYGIPKLYNPQGHPYQPYPYQPYTTSSSTCNVNVVQRQGSSPHCYYPANIGRIEMMQQVVSDSVNSDQTLTLEEAKTEPLAICELCEVNHYKWKCLTCSVHICEICKRAHIKSKLSSNHNVVETMATISDPIMICKEQETEMCNVHSNEKIQMFCTACKIFVCHDCIVDGLHRNHNFLKIDNVLRSKQSELTTIISKLEKKLANIVDARETLKENQKKYKDENDKLFATVRNHNQQLKNEIDKITKDITSKIQHQVRIDEGIFKQRNEQIIKLDTELTNLMTQCKEQQNETNLKLVSFVTKVEESCKNFDTDRHEFSHLHPPKFKVHPINSDDFRKLFGDLECDPEIGSDYVPN